MGELRKLSNVILASWSLEQNSNKMCWYLLVGGKTECFLPTPCDFFVYPESSSSHRPVKAHCVMISKKNTCVQSNLQVEFEGRLRFFHYCLPFPRKPTTSQDGIPCTLY